MQTTPNCKLKEPSHAQSQSHHALPLVRYSGRGGSEEAAQFYTSIFKNSKIGTISRYDEAGHEVHGRPAGSVMTVEFEGKVAVGR
jgi:predicted 3-demethylubiquinone-9 3-methyltransferase (glyoxalase superfamily)